MTIERRRRTLTDVEASKLLAPLGEMYLNAWREDPFNKPTKIKLQYTTNGQWFEYGIFTEPRFNYALGKQRRVLRKCRRARFLSEELILSSNLIIKELSKYITRENLSSKIIGINSHEVLLAIPSNEITKLFNYIENAINQTVSEVDLKVEYKDLNKK